MTNLSHNWGLTPGEKRALLLFCSAILLGAGFRYYQRHSLPNSIPLNAEDSLAVDAIRQAYLISINQNEAEGDPGESGIEASGLLSDLSSRDETGESEVTLRLNLNAATLDQLENLPGIGPILANRIIEERDRQQGFETLEELLAVPGIGPKRLARIRPLVSCSPLNEKTNATVDKR